MTGEVSYLSAAFAGLLSFLSPCVLPLVPFYLAYLGGTSLEQFSGKKEISAEDYARIIASAVIFVLGFTTVFVALGAGANTVFRFFGDYRDILGKIGGVIIILFGLHFLGLLKIPFLYREARFHIAERPAGMIGAYIMGLAFAFGWTPCIGPVLSLILAMAATADSFQTGVTLLFVYSLGLGIPFILAAFAVGSFMGFMKRFRKHMVIIEKVMGGFLIVAGILFLTGSMQTIGTWLLEMFPSLATIG